VTFNPASPGSPTPVTLANSGSLLLDAIACPSTNQCTTVGTTGQEVTFNPVSPAGATPSRISGAGSLWGVACTSVVQCIAVDDTGHGFVGTASTPTLALSVALAGSGLGSVSSSPAGISCGSTCSHNYASGTQVTLTATAASGSTFAGWSGAGCSGTGSCTVTMSASESVTATFNAMTPTYTLTVSPGGKGSGAVTSSPAGIDCGTTCSHGYLGGTSVTLRAVAASNSTFSGWSGACTGTGECTVTMSSPHSVTASFAQKPVVPKVTGKTLKSAEHAIKAAGLKLGSVRHKFSKKVKKGRVISQSPKAHTRLKKGAKVSLVVSKGKH
jgi:PASTA domain/Divergent InlB B-repeat domain